MHPVGLSLTNRYLEQIKRIENKEQNTNNKKINNQ